MDDDSARTQCHGTSLDHFAEHSEVSSLISSLPHVCEKLRTLETSQQRFTVILDNYQEQPHLLDPYLESLIQQLFVLASPSSAPIIMHQAFKYLYLISKVRGAKVVVRWFSHEVSDLNPVLGLLQQQDIQDHQTWETRYILLLWLSIIVIIPFNLSRMDGSMQYGGQDKGQQTTVDRVLEVAKMYLHVTDKSRDAAALLLAKFLSRPDVKKLKMAEFLDWCLVVLNEADRDTSAGMAVLTGVLTTLSSLFKHGKREEMVEYAPTILTHLAKCDLANNNNTLLRKLNIKLAQRLGMAFLSARLASWRYTRGSRSLEETLAGPTNSSERSQGSGGGDRDKEEGYDVPEEMEEVLGLLLNGLRDRDTVVRWSAAKGVGRVTGRLPKELGDEVVGSLLEFFSVRESDTAWHGGCLALAELGRRGLLLPQRLSDVVTVVLKALVYDERRGSYSVGSHVRDAACYVSWAFARAYDPEELKPYVKDIAIALATTTVFDREVNCRRAASAAFQENVGRQGTFPHGIDILTTADYFAVGSCSNAYLNLSVYVAQYSEYTRPLIDHLVNFKLSHWDSVIRELSAEALHNLTVKDPAYMKDEILPSLLPLVTTPDPSLRHGALCAVAELSFALYEQAQSTNTTFSEHMGAKIISELANIVPRLQDCEVFKGIIGEIMRPATLKFIERMCLCKLSLDDSPEVIKSWQAIVDDNLSHTEEYIRDAASSALKHLCSQYYCTDKSTINRVQNNIVTGNIAQLSNPLHFVRMGASLRLGALPRPLLVGKLTFILDKLMHCVVTIKDCDPKFVEARRDAVRAISSICQTVGVSSSGDSEESICAENIGPIYQSLFAAMRDYTTDSRGDIGTVVREAGMTAIVDLMLLVASTEEQLLTEEIVRESVCCLVQQSNEKIDRTRALACDKLVMLIHHTPALPHIPHHKQLIEIFDKSKLVDVNWAAPHLSFSFTIQLLDLPTYSYPTLLGLVVSVGGLTESTVRYSSQSLLGFIKGICSSHQKMDPFCSDVLKVFQEEKQDARVIVPLFKTLDLLLSNGVFDVYMKVESASFTSSLLEHAKEEIRKSKDVKKLLSSINVFCGLLQFPTIRKSTLNQVMLLLCHHYPKVRKTTADQFYITLVSYDDIVDAEVVEDVISILSDTAWDGDLASIRTQRDSLCDLLDLPKPKIVKKAEPSNVKKRKFAGDLDSYKDLVDRAAAGY